MKPFYIILRDKPQSFVNKRHGTAESAGKEAARLARKEGDRFFVLKVLGSVEPAGAMPVKWERAVK